jgi:hypothetical protein
VADLLDGLARYLADRGLVDYQPDSGGGDCYLESMPQTPDEVVILTLYGGPEPDSRLPYDEPRLQVRARGIADRRVSYQRAQLIYDELNGLGPVTLPDGTQLLLCYGLQTPESMGLDDNGRHEHTCNYQLETVAPTAHRPL